MTSTPVQKARQARLFISYKRQADPDEALALFLAKSLELAGCKVFIDQEMALGSKWAEKIYSYIDESDVFILLLSDSSTVSLEIQNEFRRARKSDKKSREIVPIRLAGFSGNLPFEFASVIETLQNFQWNSDRDSQKLMNHLATVVRTAGFQADSIDVESEISASRSSRFEAAREGVIPLVSETLAITPPTDDTLFIVHQTEFLFEMFMTGLEPVISGGLIPPSDVDGMFIDYKTMVNAALSGASRPGKDKRLMDSLQELRGAIDDVLSRVLPRLREIPREARYTSWDEEDRANEERAAKYKARGGLEGSEVVPELVKGMAEAFTKSMKDQRRLEQALKSECTALQLRLDDHYASISGRVQFLAEQRRWREGTWGFDLDLDTRRQIRKLCNESNGVELLRLLRRSSMKRASDPFPTILYLTFSGEPMEPAIIEQHVEMAVRALLMIPPSAAHNEIRGALYEKACYFAAAKFLTALRQAGNFSESPRECAGAVLHAFEVGTEHSLLGESPTTPALQMFILASMNQFEEAFNLAVSEEANWNDDAETALWAAKIASRAGKQKYALRWLKLRIAGMPPLDFRELSTDPDLQALRESNPAGLALVLKLSYRLEWKNCFWLADLILTNDSIFPVSNVSVQFTMGGKAFRQSCELIPPSGSYKWADISPNIGKSNQTIPLTKFTVKSDQGTYRK